MTRRYQYHESKAHLDATAAAMRAKFGPKRHNAAIAAWVTHRNASQSSANASPRDQSELPYGSPSLEPCDRTTAILGHKKPWRRLGKPPAPQS